MNISPRARVLLGGHLSKGNSNELASLGSSYGIALLTFSAIQCDSCAIHPDKVWWLSNAENFRPAWAAPCVISFSGKVFRVRRGGFHTSLPGRTCECSLPCEFCRRRNTRDIQHDFTAHGAIQADSSIPFDLVVPFAVFPGVFRSETARPRESFARMKRSDPADHY